ncbi:hypothetical protein WJX77_003989 [Trebouxia sp. C0004]
MPCPRDPIGNAIGKCPFLHQVSADQGEQYARQIATRPAVTACTAGPRPVFEEKACDFEATLKLFHGAAGLVPLKKVVAGTATCEKAAHLTQTSLDASHYAPSSTATQQRSSLSGAPFASMSMAGAFNFLPGPQNVANLLFGKKGLRGENVRKPSHSQGSGSSSRSTARGPVAGQATAATQQSGQCPLRKFPGAQIVGGLIPLSAKGKLQCPRAIVAGRAFVARMQPVRDLRPQALPVKLATLGVGTSILNIPFGMWREHTRKFSPEWFLAVHATIPFVAMTRQGIGMPKTVIFLTIGSAILGQALGARLERQRLLSVKHDEQLRQQQQAMLEEARQTAEARRRRVSLNCSSVQDVQDRFFGQQRNHIMSLAHDFVHHDVPVGA